MKKRERRERERERASKTQVARALRNARESRFIAKGQPRAMSRAFSCRWQHATIHLSYSHILCRAVPRRVVSTSRATMSSLARKRLASLRLALPLHVLLRLASPRLASRSCRVAHASNVFLRRARFFAAAFLLPFSRTRVYIFLRQLNRVDSWLPSTAFFCATIYCMRISLQDTRRDRYYSEYFCSF